MIASQDAPAAAFVRSLGPYDVVRLGDGAAVVAVIVDQRTGAAVSDQYHEFHVARIEDGEGTNRTALIGKMGGVCQLLRPPAEGDGPFVATRTFHGFILRNGRLFGQIGASVHEIKDG